MELFIIAFRLPFYLLRCWNSNGNDSILGGAAGDILSGGNGYDIRIGGPGNETFKNYDVAILQHAEERSCK